MKGEKEIWTDNIFSKNKESKGLWAQLQETPVHKVEYNSGTFLIEDMLKDCYNAPKPKEWNIIVSEREYKLATENPEEFKRQWMEMIKYIAEEGDLI